MRKDRMEVQRIILSAAAFLLIAGVSGGVIGCQSGDKVSHSPLPTAAEVAANNQKSIESIRNNPNIPQATKDRIIAQLEGKYKPSSKPQPPTR